MIITRNLIGGAYSIDVLKENLVARINEYLTIFKGKSHQNVSPFKDYEPAIEDFKLDDIKFFGQEARLKVSIIPVTALRKVITKMTYLNNPVIVTR